MHCGPNWPFGIPVWYLSNKKWQYAFKQNEDVPVWHIIPYCPILALCQCDPLSNTCLFGPSRLHISNGILTSSAILSAQIAAGNPHTLERAGPFRPHSHAGIWNQPYTCFLVPIQVHIQNGISIGSAAFAGPSD